MPAPLALVGRLALAALACAAPRVARAVEPPTLPLDQAEAPLPTGYSRLHVEVRPGAIASIAVFGPRNALRHFAVDGVVAHDPLSEDGMLPRVASFVAPEGVSSIDLSVELDLAPGEEAFVARAIAAPPFTPPPPAPPRRHAHAADDEPFGSLIGMPSPSRREDGYLLERPGRYQFARPDVAWALVEAFRDVRRRFRRDPIGLTDLSQWDARRPAIDVGKPRHVSHEGGRDVDIGLPSTIEPSLLRDHCEKEIARDYTKAWCKRGTSRELDAARLAFLLGRLVKAGGVDKVFLDREFIPAVADAARGLLNPRSFPAAVVDRLQVDAGLIHHLPWHTDHVHVRFVGPKAASPFAR